MSSKTPSEKERISLWVLFLKKNFDAKCMTSSSDEKENHEIFESN